MNILILNNNEFDFKQLDSINNWAKDKSTDTQIFNEKEIKRTQSTWFDILTKAGKDDIIIICSGNKNIAMGKILSTNANSLPNIKWLDLQSLFNQP